MTPASAVETIRLGLANVHVVRGRRPILVDAGAPGDADAIANALGALGVDPAGLGLLLLTHAHGDHAGAAAELRRRFGMPVALGALETGRAAAGRNGPLPTQGIEARLIRPFVDRRFEPFAPDVVVDGSLDLGGFGVDGTAVLAPAHTDGSLVVQVDRHAVVADLLRGGRLGGRLGGRRPYRHYFMEHPERTAGILEGLAATGARRLHLGHGGPVALEDALRVLAP